MNPHLSHIYHMNLPWKPNVHPMKAPYNHHRIPSTHSYKSNELPTKSPLNQHKVTIKFLNTGWVNRLQQRWRKREARPVRVGCLWGSRTSVNDGIIPLKQWKKSGENPGNTWNNYGTYEQYGDKHRKHLGKRWNFSNL